MKRFSCPNCSNELYFDSRSCEVCGRRVGYVPLSFGMATLSADAQGVFGATIDGVAHHPCLNAEEDACNWLVAEGDGNGACLSCRHNQIVPDLKVAQNLEAWRALERAKRQMFYSLLRWHLSAPTRREDPKSGLVFDFLASTTNPDGSFNLILTGHEEGHITLNIAEADDAVREKIRTAMREPYRTLLGHFRHEIGHYYWDRLVRDTGGIPAFRAVFGDESADYAAALKRNYEQGPPADWQQSFITSYASVHPWEDFAETWAHYIHIVDSLETARAYGMSVCAPSVTDSENDAGFKPYEAPNVKAILEAWVPFTLAMNSINRSMGQRDFYPFVISGPVMTKLAFIHGLVHRQPG